MAELIAILSAAKALGFDLTRIMEMVIIFFFVTIAVCLIFWKALKSHKESLDKVAQAMDKIANALENVMAKIDETSSNVKILERRIYKIEAQINEPFTEEEQENESNQSV